jgi:hypothetical protein
MFITSQRPYRIENFTIYTAKQVYNMQRKTTFISHFNYVQGQYVHGYIVSTNSAHTVSKGYTSTNEF